MTRLLERAFCEAAKLPPEEQAALAAQLLAELESEARWPTAFGANIEAVERLADQALEEHPKGGTQPLDPEKL